MAPLTIVTNNRIKKFYRKKEVLSGEIENNGLVQKVKVKQRMKYLLGVIV